MTTADDRPNILVFLTDDHAAWAMRCAGTHELHTPSMDRIAARGVRFARASCVSPVCSPARASFWTGTLPSWHGVHDHINRSGGGHPGIGDQRTLAEDLQAAGYRTGLIGKWHCHCAPWKRRPGFDRWFSMARGTNAQFGAQPFVDEDRHVERYGHQAPILTEEALRFLRSAVARDGVETAADGRRGGGAEAVRRPFFCCVGYTDTHTPLAGAPERLVDVYRRRGHPSIPEHETPPTHLGEVRMGLDPASPEGAEPIAQYYAAVSMIDEQVGRLLDELESLGELERTIVLYTADHGHNTGHHGLVCKGNATRPQNFLEESIEIPLLACGPGIGPGQVRHDVVDHCDTYQTILELAGATPGDDAPRPGRSWLPLVSHDPESARHESQATSQARVTDQSPVSRPRSTADRRARAHRFCEYGNARMISDGRLKLIRRWPTPDGHHHPDVLIDLIADPRETTDRSDDPAYAADRELLSTALDAHFARYQHPERSGLRLAEQPIHNAAEPWR